MYKIHSSTSHLLSCFARLAKLCWFCMWWFFKCFYGLPAITVNCSKNHAVRAHYDTTCLQAFVRFEKNNKFSRHLTSLWSSEQKLLTNHVFVKTLRKKFLSSLNKPWLTFFYCFLKCSRSFKFNLRLWHNKLNLFEKKWIFLRWFIRSPFVIGVTRSLSIDIWISDGWFESLNNNRNVIKNCSAKKTDSINIVYTTNLKAQNLAKALI